VNSFWESRSNRKLKTRPEKHGQELFGLFSRAKLSGKGSAIREAVSGTGFVDVLVTFSSGLLHVVELKMLKGKDIPGPAQLLTYMRHRQRREGWLVFFDTRESAKREKVPRVIKSGNHIIRTIVVDINPIAPHKAA